MFGINDDMDRIAYKSWHNWFHYFATVLIGYLIHLAGFSVPTVVLVPYLIGVLWELGDGFKPWYYDFVPTGNKVRDWLVSNLFYSNKFSMQDVLVWDLAGMLTLLVIYG